MAENVAPELPEDEVTKNELKARSEPAFLFDAPPEALRAAQRLRGRQRRPPVAALVRGGSEALKGGVEGRPLRRGAALFERCERRRRVVVGVAAAAERGERAAAAGLARTEEGGEGEQEGGDEGEVDGEDEEEGEGAADAERGDDLLAREGE